MPLGYNWKCEHCSYTGLASTYWEFCRDEISPRRFYVHLLSYLPEGANG